MDSITPYSQERNTTNPDSAGRRFWPWMYLGVAVLLCLILFLYHQKVSHARKKAYQEMALPATVSEDASPIVCFTRDDIEVNDHWTLLSGRHPVVKFRCALSAAAPSCKRAVFCYRPVGEQMWNTVDARLTPDRVARITLRDLYRDMPYECFFVIVARDTLLQSATLRFETSTLAP